MLRIRHNTPEHLRDRFASYAGMKHTQLLARFITELNEVDELNTNNQEYQSALRILHANDHPLAVEYILDSKHMKIHSVYPQFRAWISSNPSDTVVNWLIAHPEHISLPEFLHNGNERALEYALSSYDREVVAKHLTSPTIAGVPFTEFVRNPETIHTVWSMILERFDSRPLMGCRECLHSAPGWEAKWAEWFANTHTLPRQKLFGGCAIPVDPLETVRLVSSSTVLFTAGRYDLLTIALESLRSLRSLRSQQQSPNVENTLSFSDLPRQFLTNHSEAAVDILLTYLRGIVEKYPHPLPEVCCNTNGRIVDFLIAHPDLIHMDDFVKNPHPRAVKWVLDHFHLVVGHAVYNLQSNPNRELLFHLIDTTDDDSLSLVCSAGQADDCQIILPDGFFFFKPNKE